MKLVAQKKGKVIVAKVEGRLDSAVAAEFETAIMEVVKNGAKQVVVDFHDVSYIASAGLRVLLMAAKQLKAGGGVIALCDMTPSIKEVFEVSGFDQILPIFEDQTSAVKSLKGERDVS